MTKPKAHLLVLDDHRLFGDSLQLVLQQMPQVGSVHTAHSAQVLLDDSNAVSSYDLILMDLSMPGLDGHGFLKALKSRNINTRVAILSGVENLEVVQHAIALGAVGYIPKISPMKVLQEAVTELLAGKNYLPQNLYGKLAATEASMEGVEGFSTDVGRIGGRQIEVLKLIQQGRSNKEIATILDIKVSTVKTHIAILLSSLGVKNRTACVHKAVETGLI